MEKKLKIKEKKGRAENFFLSLLLVAAIGVCIFACQNLCRIFSEYRAGTNEYNKIKETVVIEKDAGEEEIRGIMEEPKKKEWKAPITVDFDQLAKTNKDVCGWLYAEAVPDINYPVVQASDNEYYLHRTFEKKENFAGTLFIDCDNSSDFDNCNTIIYGHNMKNGSMFGQLKKYKEQETYEKSKYIWILTPEKDYKYEIISAYVAPIRSETYMLIKGPCEEQKEYAEHMLALSEIETGDHSFDIRDKLLTLSTCTGDESTRYVVQAVRIDPV